MAWLIIWTQMVQNILLGPRPQGQDIFLIFVNWIQIIIPYKMWYFQENQG